MALFLVMWPLSWYQFCVSLPPEVRTVGLVLFLLAASDKGLHGPPSDEKGLLGPPSDEKGLHGPPGLKD